MDFGIQVTLIVLFALAGTSTCYTLRGNITNTKSKVEGENICIRKAPYQVYLQVGNAYFCGGVLIEQDVVLTAAHCVQAVIDRNDELYIVAGTDKPTGKMTRVKAGKIKMHEKFSLEGLKEAYKYDIAIIMLTAKLPKTKKIRPVALAKEDVIQGQHLFLSGIGSLHPAAGHSFSHLKAFTTIVVSCENRLPFKYAKTYDAVICHKNYKGHKACAGDSGSPLIDKEGNLVGIHTRSPSLNFQVAINVFHYLDWIKDYFTNYYETGNYSPNEVEY